MNKMNKMNKINKINKTETRKNNMPRIRYCEECLHMKSHHIFTKKGKVYVCKDCGCTVKKTAFTK